MPPAFLDTNIILRHVLGDHPDHSPRATAYLARVEQGEIEVYTSDTVIFEVVFTLQRQYQQPRAEIRQAILPLIELPGIILPGKRRYRQVFDLYVELNLSFADTYHAVLMRHLNIDEIVTFDRGFDRIPGVKRCEP
ncbi:MAG: PIN domain-containing protein [Dehalococcoidia bacterium]|nr:PIN domain-containing protein [Dehalococcoidia bacterium]